MKKVLAILLCLVLVMSMVACGGGGEEPAVEEGPLVVLITDTGGLGDESFNDSAWAGFERARDELGVQIQVIESASSDDYLPNIAAAVEAGAALIVCNGFLMAEATQQGVDQYPDQAFALIDSVDAQGPNLLNLTFNEQEGSFLVGVAAAMLSESDIIGFVGGIQLPTIEKFQYGFEAGVQAVKPDAQVLVNYTQSFSDAALGKENALAQNKLGADVIYHASGGCGIGVIQAAGEQGFWAIGVDQDQSGLDPEHVLCSMIKRVDNATYKAIESVVSGTFEGGNYVFSLVDEGIGVGDNAGNLPEDVAAEIDAWKTRILDAEFVVPFDAATFAEFSIE